MIEPTVGRIVLYHPHSDDGGDVNGQPHAAIVAHVLSGRLVNLTVFNENGSTYARTQIVLVQGDEAEAGLPVPTSDFAEWMDYQKGQAAKAEAAESVLAQRLDEQIREVDAKFQTLGDWLQPALKALDERITAIPLQPQPAKPPQDPAGVPGGAGAAPQGQA
jgi:hypothetical protein